MSDYIAEHLGMSREAADKLRVQYWRRYGATLLGLERHHGIRAAHFLAQTHVLPGRKFLLTIAPADYDKRVLTALDLASCFEGVIAIEGMRVFGDLRPKPDA